MPPRFFKHGELPLVLLALVDQTPRHGYDIMSELNRLFGPKYRASPGSIYPAIEALQTEGLIQGESQGGKVVYHATQSGHDAIDERADMIAALEVRVGVHLRSEDSLGSLLTQFKARLTPLSGHVDVDAAAMILGAAAVDIELLKPTRSHQQRKHHAG